MQVALCCASSLSLNALRSGKQDVRCRTVIEGVVGVAFLRCLIGRDFLASFEFRVGVLPGQARAQARRSERLTRVGEVS